MFLRISSEYVHHIMILHGSIRVILIPESLRTLNIFFSRLKTVIIYLHSCWNTFPFYVNIIKHKNFSSCSLFISNSKWVWRDVFPSITNTFLNKTLVLYNIHTQQEPLRQQPGERNVLAYKAIMFEEARNISFVELTTVVRVRMNGIEK